MNAQNQKTADQGKVVEPKQSQTLLNESEQERLDELFSFGRLFHYTNFIVAGIAWALSTLERKPDLQLPIGGLSLPTIQAFVALYLVSVALTMATVQSLRMAERWSRLDPRRPPYAWLAVGIQGHDDVGDSLGIRALAAGNCPHCRCLTEGYVGNWISDSGDDCSWLAFCGG